MERSRFVAVSLALLTPASGAQSLYERPVTAAAPVRAPNGAAHGGSSSTSPRPVEGDAPAPMQEVPGSAPVAASPTPVVAVTPRRRAAPLVLSEVSLYAIEAPPLREFAENDLVTIIISERSKTERNQKLDAKKEYDLEAKITAWIRLMELLELRAVPDGKSESELPSVGAELSTDFKGDGKYGREDKLTDRIQARVVEVKPNGTLLIEARRSIQTDEEVQEVVLSGLCRQEDVTDANTVQSNQLYDLRLNVQNAGEVKKAGEKGLIPRVLDGLFNL